MVSVSCELRTLARSSYATLNALFSTNAYSRERMNQPEYIQKPEDDDNNHYRVQN